MFLKETLKSADTSDDDVLVEGGPVTITSGVEDDEAGGVGKENDNLKMSLPKATINVPAPNTDYRKKSCSFLGGGGVSSILYPSSSSSSKSKSFNYEYPADLDSSTSSTGGGGSGKYGYYN